MGVGGEMEIVVRATDQTAAGLKAAEKGMANLGRNVEEMNSKMHSRTIAHGFADIGEQLGLLSNSGGARAVHGVVDALHSGTPAVAAANLAFVGLTVYLEKAKEKAEAFAKSQKDMMGAMRKTADEQERLIEIQREYDRALTGEERSAAAGKMVAEFKRRVDEAKQAARQLEDQMIDLQAGQETGIARTAGFLGFESGEFAAKRDLIQKQAARADYGGSTAANKLEEAKRLQAAEALAAAMKKLNDLDLTAFDKQLIGIDEEFAELERAAMEVGRTRENRPEFYADLDLKKDRARAEAFQKSAKTVQDTIESVRISLLPEGAEKEAAQRTLDLRQQYEKLAETAKQAGAGQQEQDKIIADGKKAIAKAVDEIIRKEKELLDAQRESLSLARQMANAQTQTQAVDVRAAKLAEHLVDPNLTDDENEQIRRKIQLLEHENRVTEATAEIHRQTVQERQRLNDALNDPKGPKDVLLRAQMERERDRLEKKEEDAVKRVKEADKRAIDTEAKVADFTAKRGEAQRELEKLQSQPKTEISSREAIANKIQLAVSDVGRNAQEELLRQQIGKLDAVIAGGNSVIGLLGKIAAGAVKVNFVAGT